MDYLKGFGISDNVFDFEWCSSLFTQLEGITYVIFFKLEFWQIFHQLKSREFLDGMQADMPKLFMPYPSVVGLHSETSKSIKIRILRT